MGQYANFYNSVNKDRVYDADSFAEWLRPFFKNGVFNGELQVLAGEGMVITVSSGSAYIDGKMKHFDEPHSLAIEISNATLGRIDNVIVRRNDIERDFTVMIQKGTNSASPIAPTPIRSNGIYDLVLAQIAVNAAVIEITQIDITDTRMNSDLCGWVASNIEEIKFDQISAQFDAFFESIKGILGEDEAGKLLQLIQDINTQYEVVVPIEGWILNSTTNLYELTISSVQAHEYTKKPTWGLVNVETTAEGIEAEETAFAVIKTAGFSEGTILLTATEVPETSVTIIVTVL